MEFDCSRLPNEIWLQVLGSLPHRDLIHMRLVNKRFFGLVSLPDFYNRTKIKITRDNLDAIKTRVYTDPDSEGWCFQNVELNGLHSSEDLQAVLRLIGPFVRTLMLENTPVFEELAELVPYVWKLSVVWRNLNRIDSFDLNKFKSLRSIDLSCSEISRQLKAGLLQQLTSEVTDLRLEELSLEHSTQEEWILRVLETHAETLTRLSVHFFSPPLLGNAIWGVVFQQLRSLCSVKFSGCLRIELLEAIFMSIPSSAPLSHIDLAGNIFLTDDLLKEIIAKWGQGLQKLEIMFCVHITDDSIRELSKVRHSLRVLNMAFCRKITKSGLLEGIACERNTVLQGLYLNDLHQLDPDCILQLAERLPNLEVLNLENCNNAVNDEVLAQVFRNQTRVRSLLLDDCTRITDQGMVGFGEMPYPISRLQSLQALSVRGCRNLSNRTLANLNLRELRKLRLGYCHKISTPGIEELVKGCPALEDLIISSCLMLDDECVYHIASSLKRLRKLNLSSCLNLSERSIDHIINHCHTLQELVLVGIDSLDIRYVKERFLEVNRHLKQLIF